MGPLITRAPHGLRQRDEEKRPVPGTFQKAEELGLGAAGRQNTGASGSKVLAGVGAEETKTVCTGLKQKRKPRAK